MERRRFLTAMGTSATAGAVGLAGCGSPGGNGGDGTPGGGPTPGEATPGQDTPEETPAAETPAEDTPAEDTPAQDTLAEETPEETPGQETLEEGTPQGGGGAQAPEEASVDMLTDGEDYLFDPIGVHVAPGGTVTWVNQSGSHSSTAYTEDNPQSETRRVPEDAEGWDSGIISEEGGEFSHTFETEGTYDYYCTPHKSLGMVARVVVGEPGGPGEERQPPDGEVPDS